MNEGMNRWGCYKNFDFIYIFFVRIGTGLLIMIQVWKFWIYSWRNYVKLWISDFGLSILIVAIDIGEQDIEHCLDTLNPTVRCARLAPPRPPPPIITGRVGPPWLRIAWPCKSGILVIVWRTRSLVCLWLIQPLLVSLNHQEATIIFFSITKRFDKNWANRPKKNNGEDANQIHAW